MRITINNADVTLRNHCIANVLLSPIVILSKTDKIGCVIIMELKKKSKNVNKIKTKPKFARLFIPAILLILTIFAISPANAAINQIYKGDTVFMGEQGLFLNSGVFYSSGGVTDTQLAYFKSGNPATDSPEYTLTPSPNSFYVSPADFRGREGTWYSYPNGSLNSHSAIYVQYPSLGLKLYAYRPGGESFDITYGKIVSGEALDFRIDSNLYPIFTRQGVTSSDKGVDVKVKTPDGATLTSLYDCSKNLVKITGIHPQTSSYFAPSGTLTCVWDTGNSAYNTGSYTIWAECNVNGMMDNLGEITGATITSPIGTIQKTETVEAGFTKTPAMTQTPSPTKTKTPEKTKTPTPVPSAKTPTPTIEKTAEPTAVQTEITEKTETATDTKKPGETAQLPQTPLGLLGVFSALIIISAIEILKRR